MAYSHLGGEKPNEKEEGRIESAWFCYCQFGHVYLDLFRPLSRSQFSITGFFISITTKKWLWHKAFITSLPPCGNCFWSTSEKTFLVQSGKNLNFLVVTIIIWKTQSINGLWKFSSNAYLWELMNTLVRFHLSVLDSRLHQELTRM